MPGAASASSAMGSGLARPIGEGSLEPVKAGAPKLAPWAEPNVPGTCTSCRLAPNLWERRALAEASAAALVLGVSGTCPMHEHT
jgi:hypothetical protein